VNKKFSANFQKNFLYIHKIPFPHMSHSIQTLKKLTAMIPRMPHSQKHPNQLLLDLALSHRQASSSARCSFLCAGMLGKYLIKRQ
jgi:hypothetical protein